MDATPKIPTLKDSKKPQVKVRGLGAGLTLAERLKQFKKKDLAFILAGLGVLFMAPLAEHFMMTPEGGDGTLKPGWSGPGSSGSGSLGGGGSPYERTDGLAPGGPAGGGADIITPLNVRDPSSLIMGPSAAQQPPTNSALAGTPPGSPTSSRSDADLKDALAASARGLGAAAKKAPMPMPKVALGGSGLRGLGVAGGGSSASAGLGGISAANVPNKASMADSTGNARPTKGYGGVARGQTQGGSGIDALKAAASKQGEGFNRSGSAAADLNAAAQTAIPAGGAGGSAGGPSAGKEDKGFGGSQDKGSKSVGESLAFLEKKSRMEKDLELEYKKKEKNDWGLIGADLRNESLKTFAGEMTKFVAGTTTDLLKGFLEKSNPKEQYVCSSGRTNIIASAVGTCGEPGVTYAKGGSGNSIVLYICVGKESKEQIASGCHRETSLPDDKKIKEPESGSVVGLDFVKGDTPELQGIAGVCALVDQLSQKTAEKDSQTVAARSSGQDAFIAKVKPELKKIASARAKLTGQGACDVKPAGDVSAELSNTLSSLDNGLNGLNDGRVWNLKSDEAVKVINLSKPSIQKAETFYSNAQQLIEAAKTEAEGADVPLALNLGSQYDQIQADANKAKIAISNLADTLLKEGSVHKEIGNIVKSARGNVDGVSGVNDVNDQLTDLQTAIGKVNAKQPEGKKITPPTVEPVEPVATAQGAGADDAATVVTVVDKAKGLLQTACSAISAGKDCKTDPPDIAMDEAFKKAEKSVAEVTEPVATMRKTQAETLAAVQARVKGQSAAAATVAGK
ncbi:MAG TPA: hypothetical protein DCZ01_09710 [Elusimicrobia bacterium]|nr:MAG: hypothetical protein A2X37_09270 [Elusimicrobia bacterium GWA2_66_18]OGR70850.1 MAG: hypothetical protein A2X40_05915 [Elusimicrobia bacterium GWC2_65_9]HAZ08775.1 hypothetical protein [Elusimicrobiota bacterium]